MNVRQLIIRTQVRTIPPIVEESLRKIEGCNTARTPSFLPKDPIHLATDLLKSYFDNGLVSLAHKLFHELPERDLVTWTAMIYGYASCNYHSKAMEVFRDMRLEGIEPNGYTISSTMKACKGIKSVECGRALHCLAIKQGIEGLIYVDNTVMDMYAACGDNMDDAMVVFEQMVERNSVSWTTLITGYTHRGQGYQALMLFRNMLYEEELSPFSFSIAVRACTMTGSNSTGRQIHASVTKHGFKSNLPVMNSILDMYCKCSCLSEAGRCFHQMDEKDMTTWNTLISGCERSSSALALRVYSSMVAEGVHPNCFTLSSIMSACADLAVLYCGQQIHVEIIRRGFKLNLASNNSLMDMYAKCGTIEDALKVFKTLPMRDLISWTSMMIAYGTHGYGKEAVRLFDEMIESGIEPDVVVFMGVLVACSHARLVDEGLRCFRIMTMEYNLSPTRDIYGCVVDLLGRAGRISEAYDVMESMPFLPDESLWGAFLGACKAHKFSNRGKLVNQRMLTLHPNMVGTCVLLSNIYAAEGKWAEFAEVRKMMRGMESRKVAGRSWVEVRNRVYGFMVEDKMCVHVDRVYEVLENLLCHMKDVGYFAELEMVELD